MSHVLGVGSLGPVFLCVAGSGASLDLSSLFWLSARSVRVVGGLARLVHFFVVRWLQIHCLIGNNWNCCQKLSVHYCLISQT